MEYSKGEIKLMEFLLERKDHTLVKKGDEFFIVDYTDSLVPKIKKLNYFLVMDLYTKRVITLEKAHKDIGEWEMCFNKYRAKDDLEELKNGNN